MSDIVSRSSRTSTKTVNGVQTTIVETTIKRADGTTETTKEETTGNASASGGSMMSGGLMSGMNDIEKGTEKMKLFGDDDGPRAPRTMMNNNKPAAPVDVDIDTFRTQALKAHNEKRDLHSAPAMKLCDDLNKYAQNWADHLIKAGKFEHSDCQGHKLGENICTKWSMPAGDYTGDEAVGQWYAEEPKHNYKGDHQGGSGHFTQVVWKGSTELGMGKAKDGKGKVIVVGSYRPAGNMIGSFQKNISPPKK